MKTEARTEKKAKVLIETKSEDIREIRTRSTTEKYDGLDVGTRSGTKTDLETKARGNFTKF